MLLVRRYTTLDRSVVTLYNYNPLQSLRHCTDNPMFEVRSRDHTPEFFGELEGVSNNDYILDLTYLRNFYKKILGGLLYVWNAHIGGDYVMFYTLDCAYVPKIACSIKINSTLITSVFLDGREMDTADLTWIIPISGRITQWSQLRVLLAHYGHPGGLTSFDTTSRKSSKLCALGKPQNDL